VEDETTITPLRSDEPGARAEIDFLVETERLTAGGVVRELLPSGRINMGKGLILWMLGVPGIVVLALLFTHVI
jgi:hypothetical protein